jgi:hypothetical protein
MSRDRNQEDALDSPPEQPFAQLSFSLGAGENLQVDKALAIAEAAEDEEIINKLRLG